MRAGTNSPSRIMLVGHRDMRFDAGVDGVSSVRSTVPSRSSTQKRPLTGRSRPPVVATNVGRPLSREIRSRRPDRSSSRLPA